MKKFRIEFSSGTIIEVTANDRNDAVQSVIMPPKGEYIEAVHEVPSIGIMNFECTEDNYFKMIDLLEDNSAIKFAKGSGKLRIIHNDIELIQDKFEKASRMTSHISSKVIL